MLFHKEQQQIFKFSNYKYKRFVKRLKSVETKLKYGDIIFSYVGKWKIFLQNNSNGCKILNQTYNRKRRRKLNNQYRVSKININIKSIKISTYL